MGEAAISFAVAGAYAFVCAGWGEILAKSVGFRRCSVAMDMAFGIAALVIVGGILNLLRAATWPYLSAVILIGAAVSLCRVILAAGRDQGFRLPDWRNARGVAGILIAAFAVFLAVTVFPPSAMNLDDDLKKYFPYLVRMVETGTLSGNPLNGLGYESVGGQTFLQGLVAAFAPLPYIEAFDTLFCFALTAWLAGTLAGSARELATVSVLTVLAVLFMETQHVNTSSIYSGAALIVALYALVIDPGETAAAQPRRRAFVSGLLVGALLGLKLIFLPIAGMVVISGAVREWMATRSFGAPTLWAIYVGLGASAGLAPWVAVYFPFIVEAFREHVQAETPAVVVAAAIPLLSSEGLAWRGTGLAFTAAAVVTVVAAALPISRWARLNITDRANVAALATAAVCISANFFVVVVFASEYLSGYDASIRYFAPMLAACMPATVALGARYYSAHGSPQEQRRADAVFSYLALAGLALFAPALVQRVAQAAMARNMLAYVHSASYIDRYHTLISPAHETAAQELQELVPAGAPLLLWVAAPFAFDFHRNEIYDINMAGLASPWAHIPPVQYVIWEYSGFGITRFGDLAATAYRPGTATQRAAIHMFMLGTLLRKMLNDHKRTAVLYDNGSVLVLRVEGMPREWRDRIPTNISVPR